MSEIPDGGRSRPHAAYRLGERAYDLNAPDWPGDPFVAVRAVVDAVQAHFVAEGRRQAAEAIEAHRDKFWPKDTANSAQMRVRRHMDIAIRVADPITPEQAAEAFNAWAARIAEGTDG